MVDYFIGTMGFAYKDWAGAFYPQGLSSQEYLSFYSRIFNAVEIDSTFYGTPKVGSVVRWRENSPEGFKICVKVPRSITHDAGLVDVDNEMIAFIQTVKELGDKLGVILIQLPPSFDNSNTKILQEFLEQLPKRYKFATEFRHPSWYIDQTANLLTNYGICWAATEYQGVPKEVPLTIDTIFIRLVGLHGRFRLHNREQIDVTPQLENWWKWILSISEELHEVFVFFNDDYSGYAPASANRLKKIIGLPVVDIELPKQMKMF
jgi:uncharacterized protein YecE (DUF72 family)